MKNTNRRTGRTTLMLIDLADFIHKHYNESMNIILVGHTIDYARTMLSRLSGLFDMDKKGDHIYFIGKCRIHTWSIDMLVSPNSMKGMRRTMIFIDHYKGGRYGDSYRYNVTDTL